MQVGFVRIFVTDLKKSIDFYTNVLGMEIDFTDNVNWAQFHSGPEVSLAIEQASPEHMEFGTKMVGRFVGVTLMVDNIKETYERLLDKGVEFPGAPVKQAWGGTLAHLKDLDGNVLTIMQEA